jgi:hypothetical protein
VALGLLAIVVTEERTERPRSAALSLD